MQSALKLLGKQPSDTVAERIKALEEGFHKKVEQVLEQQETVYADLACGLLLSFDFGFPQVQNSTGQIDQQQTVVSDDGSD